jgi:hypothetical protein
MQPLFHDPIQRQIIHLELPYILQLALIGKVYIVIHVKRPIFRYSLLVTLYKLKKKMYT